jgi:UDP-glucose:(heptosyl)LPS alpha-1,3-glucosyltransferase
MKLAVVTKRLSTHGGTERFGHGFIGWALAQGHAVDVWCGAVDDPVAGAKIVPLKLSGRGRMWRQVGRYRAAQQVPIDCYDGVLNLLRAPIDGVYRAGGGCHRSWVAQNGWSLADSLAVYCDKATVNRARLVVANSEMARRELVEWYGVDPNRLRLVRNGVDLARFRPDPGAVLPCSGDSIVFLGSGFHRKGLSWVLKMLAATAKLNLVVMGVDRRTPAYQREAARLGLSARVHFMGSVQHPERFLPAAKAMVLPTRYDPFANAVLEAMACGVPVITSRANGAHEVLSAPWMALERAAGMDAWVGVLKRVLAEPQLRGAARAAAEAHPVSAAYSAVFSVLEEAQR